MQAFNRASNFIVQDCSFINNSGRKETLSEVLIKLKDEAATGVSYESIDHISNPSATLDLNLLSDITSSNNNSGSDSNNLIYFINSTSPSDVRAYGENVAKHCKEQHTIHASVFLRRMLTVFPAQVKRRLVPSLAYQLTVSPYAPEELKVEILGALYMEPDIPEQNLASQVQKLLIRPLQNIGNLMQPNHPIVIILDSVQNTDCDTVTEVVTEIAQAIKQLHEAKVNAKAVITGVRYNRIVTSFKANSSTQSITQSISVPITQPYSIFSMARSVSFPILNVKYSMPELLQRAVEMMSVMSAAVVLPPILFLGSMAVLPGPLALTVAIFGPMFMVLAPTAGLMVLIYKETARLIWPRSI